MSITNIRHGYFALVLSAIWLEACGAPNLETSDSGHPSPGLVPSDPLGGLGGAPEPTSGGGACIISADCGPGTHCDLGECVQLCSRRDPCSSHRVCSPRGRCLDPADTDGDPEPSLDKAGQIRVTPAEILLTEQDGRLRLTLSTDSAEPVRYRVVPSAPYLSIARPRGEFVGDTVVELDVDITQIKGVDVAGTVRVLTNLGDVVVDAPLRVGLTGRYEGALRYSVGDVPLGAAQIVLDIREDLGDVSVKVDPERSLLFPAVQGGGHLWRGDLHAQRGARSDAHSHDPGNNRRRAESLCPRRRSRSNPLLEAHGARRVRGHLRGAHLRRVRAADLGDGAPST